MIVYKITHKYNGDSYIGQTVKTLEQRWKGHVWNAFNENHAHYNGYLQRAIRKYGPDAFETEVIHVCESKEEMDIAEILYIDFFETKSPSGYNLTDGGEGIIGLKRTDEHRRKLSESNKGKIISEETRKKMSEAHKGLNTWMVGRKRSKEARRNMSEAKKGNTYRLGTKHSEETRRKMSDSHKKYNGSTI